MEEELFGKKFEVMNERELLAVKITMFISPLIFSTPNSFVDLIEQARDECIQSPRTIQCSDFDLNIPIFVCKDCNQCFQGIEEYHHHFQTSPCTLHPAEKTLIDCMLKLHNLEGLLDG